MSRHYYFSFMLAGLLMVAWMTRVEALPFGANRTPAGQGMQTPQDARTWAPHGKFAD